MPASLKELDRRIRSVKNTQQITRAMKMVAAAKLRRAQDRLIAARPYGVKLEELLDGLAGTKIDHPLFEQRDLKRRYVVVVSSDKGLCGSYNANILREAEEWLKANDEEGVENVVYGTDIPFEWPDTMDMVLNASFLTNEDKRMILGGNIINLLNLDREV